MLPRKRRSPVAWKPPRLLALCAAVLATWVLDECRSALQYFSGAVVRVLDGDTLEVLSSGRAIRVRLTVSTAPNAASLLQTAPGNSRSGWRSKSQLPFA
jgi:endonuclease YncB( thermonuclease family)